MFRILIILLLLSGCGNKQILPTPLSELNTVRNFLKFINLVGDEEFGRFVLAMKKMDGDKAITKSEKDMIAQVFNKLITAILSDPTLVQKIAKRDN